jgi:hypothetical protein
MATCCWVSGSAKAAAAASHAITGHSSSAVKA